jgi:tetratricopeptide (TPR) repeat protein
MLVLKNKMFNGLNDMTFHSFQRVFSKKTGGLFLRVLTLMFVLLGFSASVHADEVWDRLDKMYGEAKSAEQWLEVEAELQKIKGDVAQLDEWAWRMGRIYYDLGKNSTGQAQEKFFNQCVVKAGEALSVNSNSAPGYFYKGLCIGKLGEARGLWSSLDAIDPLRENMTKALTLEPGFDHGGPHRALGKLYFELPFFLGGDGDLAVKHLEKALNLGPDYGDNYYFLAEAYQAKGKRNKARDTLAQLQRLLKNQSASEETDRLMQRTVTLLNEIESDLRN